MRSDDFTNNDINIIDRLSSQTVEKAIGTVFENRSRI